MHKILCVLAIGVVATVSGCSTGSRTEAVSPGVVNGTWVNEAGWICDGKSCRMPKAIQSPQDG